MLDIVQSRRLPEEVTTVVRVDNDSACAYINRGRELTPEMRRALHILVNVQDSNRLTVFVQHVRTEDNGEEDCLSRVHYEKAEQLIGNGGSPAWRWEQGYMEEWERYVTDSKEENEARHKLNGPNKFFT